MKKLLSPGTRKKGLGSRTFGVPLEELMSRAASGATVPYVVSKICEHIRDKGKCQDTGKICGALLCNYTSANSPAVTEVAV